MITMVMDTLQSMSMVRRQKGPKGPVYALIVEKDASE